MGRIPRVDYDEVAASYERRYATTSYPGIERLLRARAVGCGAALEVGCGTGHWLRHLAQWNVSAVGLDPSAAMLERAVAAAAHSRLTRGRAEQLPFRDGSFDLLVVINALHHFSDRPAFLREARRVLRPGGTLLNVGLDPEQVEHWYIYDYLPPARELDLLRYPSAASVRAQLLAADFVECSTLAAEQLEVDLDAKTALANGLLDKQVTSQLSGLSEHEYQAGVARIGANIAVAEGRTEAVRLRANFELFGVVATRPYERSPA